MIYWFTGQPGHGKTLHAIQKLLEFKAKGRTVYACNIRGFDYEKTGVNPMTPEQFRDWMNFLPDGSVALVDEVYEHQMLPKRAPGAKVPPHVEQLAKHRHRGLDFIFVCQSPHTQVDSFVHDLIEDHTHVRRRFGTPFVHLRRFDRYERNPEKAQPLTLKRSKLPKEIFGTYQSTELDTTERRIPWYYPAFAIGLPLVIFGGWYMTNRVFGQLSGNAINPQVEASTGAPGAKATGATGEAQTTARRSRDDYLAYMTPRVPSQPWTAPAYDRLDVPPSAPRVFCMIGGDRHTGTCSCITEQGTRYQMETNTCRLIAVNGQYEPYRDEQEADRERLDEITQRRNLAEQASGLRAPGAGWNPAATGPGGAAPQGDALPFGGVASYGQHGLTAESTPR